MKLTPLDIHHKEFRHSLRGYSEEEVDAFLDQVADEFERLFKENIDLSERLETAREQVRGYEAQKETLHNTLVAAQRSAEDIVGKAREESVSVLRDAEVKAKEIIHNALTQKQKVAAELVRIKHAEEEFRATFRKMLEGHLKGVGEISLPEDVNVLMGETDEGVVGDVDVAFEQIAPSAVSRVVPSEPKPAPVVAQPEPEPVKDAPEPSRTAVSAEPPASGFVQAINLGEVESPDLSAEEPDFDDPKEFKMTSFDIFGERDEDIDIEEID
ncbi:MAG: DivIVA domain-containing protein [Coriobacteriia bacterium]|nr:DivIVA domain-containing protein [Coriobacteriia bacterium]